eukprot:CAMPEP_0113955310 /NCGR_PEP_ID=MMETSP0011_2-20120614/1237_1 /TAXON_ID=101924 /ORGANISM="Rhodosorus marinus" /LENGTH=82 /DNA_ID=CAMNT_0000964935 /DNA_START=1573 /DNA_END=1818 /DNA_ORIENTATION=- /assembly_acc=CAM_ASM_000156
MAYSSARVDDELASPTALGGERLADYTHFLKASKMKFAAADFSEDNRKGYTSPCSWRFGPFMFLKQQSFQLDSYCCLSHEGH